MNDRPSFLRKKLGIRLTAARAIHVVMVKPSFKIKFVFKPLNTGLYGPITSFKGINGTLQNFRNSFQKHMLLNDYPSKRPRWMFYIIKACSSVWASFAFRLLGLLKLFARWDFWGFWSVRTCLAFRPVLCFSSIRTSPAFRLSGLLGLLHLLGFIRLLHLSGLLELLHVSGFIGLLHLLGCLGRLHL